MTNEWANIWCIFFSLETLNSLTRLRYQLRILPWLWIQARRRASRETRFAEKDGRRKWTSSVIIFTIILLQSVRRREWFIERALKTDFLDINCQRDYRKLSLSVSESLLLRIVYVYNSVRTPTLLSTWLIHYRADSVKKNSPLKSNERVTTKKFYIHSIYLYLCLRLCYILLNWIV